MRFLLDLAWRDLRHSGRHLWIFCACLVLGVALVAAGGGLYRQVAGALQNDARALFGGDVEVRHARPLPPDTLACLPTVDRCVPRTRAGLALPQTGADAQRRLLAGVGVEQAADAAHRRAAVLV